MMNTYKGFKIIPFNTISGWRCLVTRGEEHHDTFIYRLSSGETVPDARRLVDKIVTAEAAPIAVQKYDN